MSKRSRTFQPSASRPDPGDRPATGGTPGDADVASAASPGSPSTAQASAGSTSRAEVRRRSTAPRTASQQSFLGRYKLFIVGGAGVVVALLALLLFNRSTTQAYQCVTFLTPPPAAASESGASPRPGPAQTPLAGFQTGDMGRDHKVLGGTIEYTYCPPAGGGHYNQGGGRGPLARRFFGPTDRVIPPEWVHNLEHGDVVVLYRDDPGPVILDQLRSIMDDAQVSDWSLANCGPVNKVLVARFDDMDPGVAFAAVAWDRVLLLKEFDRAQLLAFANQWQDGPQTPERVCS